MFQYINLAFLVSAFLIVFVAVTSYNRNESRSKKFTLLFGIVIVVFTSSLSVITYQKIQSYNQYPPAVICNSYYYKEKPLN